MATHKRADGMEGFSSQVETAKRDYFDERAHRINLSRGKLITILLDFWLAIGAPPLTDGDRGTSVLPIPEDARVDVLKIWAQHAAVEKASSSIRLLKGSHGKKPSYQEIKNVVRDLKDAVDRIAFGITSDETPKAKDRK